MPQSTEPKSIRSVRYFDCGRCYNQLALVFRGHAPEKREFPSGVFLVEHTEHGYMLFDTGYSDALLETGVKGRLYRWLNPTKIEPRDEIATQLRAEGISPDRVRYVVLSHLHPDHIGGIKFFPQAQFIVSSETLGVYRDPRFSDLFFGQMVPGWFEQRVLPLSSEQLAQTTISGFTGFDFFGDGSTLLTPLPGHTRGHLGLLLNGQVLLAGDACWGSDLMCCSHRMRKAGQIIQHDFPAYLATIDKLEQAQNRGISICFAHDTYTDHQIL